MKEIKELKKIEGYTMFTDRKTQHDKDSSSLQIELQF